MKICTVCLISKPLSEFSKHKGYHNGIRSDCKKCHNEANKKFRNSDKGKQYHKNKSAEWQKSNPVKTKERKKRYRSNPINKLKEKE